MLLVPYDLNFLMKSNMDRHTLLSGNTLIPLGVAVAVIIVAVTIGMKWGTMTEKLDTVVRDTTEIKADMSLVKNKLFNNGVSVR